MMGRLMKRTAAIPLVLSCVGLAFLFLEREHLATHYMMLQGTRRTQEKDATTTSTPAAGMCSQQQRVERIQKWCDLQATIHGTPFPSVYSMEGKELKNAVRALYADDIHKVIYCAIAKAGSTSWKYILVQNAGLKEDKIRVHANGFLNQNTNITQLGTYSEEDIKSRLQDYMTFMAVRHPLDRIVSAYKDKINNPKPNRMYEKAHGTRILKQLRENATKEQLESGKGATFEEYIKFLHNDTKLQRDPHFRSFQENCMPCSIRYDYVVKLETMSVDGRHIVDKYLSGYGLNASNRHSNRGGAEEVKHLEEFEPLGEDILQKATSLSSIDLAMFGYSVRKQDGSISSVCGDKDRGECC